MRNGKEIDKGIPPDHQRCITTDGRGWRCYGWKFQDLSRCEKHYNIKKSYEKSCILKRKMKKIKEFADFSEGQQVEVARKDEGFKDSWFTAKVLRLPNVNSNKLNIMVEYDKLLAWEKRKAHLKGAVHDPCLIRPLPPPQPPNQSFQLHQCVDAFHNDGWWKGEVVKILENSRYTVHFSAWKEFTEFGADQLRLHLDWVDGRWVNPLINKEGYRRKKDIADMSVKRKRLTNQWLQRPNKKLQKEIGEGSSSPTTAPERAMSTSTRTRSMKAKEALHQETGGISQDVTDIFPNPSSRFSVHHAQNLSGPKPDVNSNLSDGAQGALFKAQSSFLQKCSDSQSQKHNKDSLGGDMINQHREGVANQTITISETRGYGIFRFESTLEEEFPAREVAHVVQLECPQEGTEIQILSNTDDAPHSVSAFSLPVNLQSRDVDANDSENRKRKTERARGRPSKKLYKGEASGGSCTDPNRTMPDSTTTELEPYTILEGQKALLQQKKGTSDHPTPNSSNLQSFVDSRLSDGVQVNEINQQEGGVEIQKSILKMEKRRLVLMLDKLEKDCNIKFKESLQKVKEKKYLLNLCLNGVAAVP